MLPPFLIRVLQSSDKLTIEFLDTKERPFKCLKCRSTFVRRDLLLRHDRTVHAKDGGIPLVSEGRRRGGNAGTQRALLLPPPLPNPLLLLILPL